MIVQQSFNDYSDTIRKTQKIPFDFCWSPEMLLYLFEWGFSLLLTKNRRKDQFENFTRQDILQNRIIGMIDDRRSFVDHLSFGIITHFVFQKGGLALKICIQFVFIRNERSHLWECSRPEDGPKYVHIFQKKKPDE